MNIVVYDKTGKEVDKITIKLPKIKLSEYELSRALRVYEFALHQGTKKAKTRGEVNRSKRKPWRQKGTGNARAGTRGSPIWVGGGVAHAPQPFQKRLKLNKQEKKRVFAWMLSKKLASGEVKLLRLKKGEKLTTKETTGLLKTLGVLPFVGFYVTLTEDDGSVLGFRNLPKITVRRAELLSIFDLYKKGFLLVKEDAFDKLKSRLGS